MANFLGFPQSSRPPGARIVGNTTYINAMPKYGRQKLEFPETAQNHDCWGSMIPSGSAGQQDTFFRNQMKNDEVTTPNSMSNGNAGRKNFSKFQYFSIGLV